MATNYSILGQAVPTSGNSDVYASPAATQTVISTIAVCNTTTSPATATIYIRKASGGTPATASTSNAFAYQQTIAALSTQTFSIGATVGAYDTITVASGTSSALTFHVFGCQVS